MYDISTDDKTLTGNAVLAFIAVGMASLFFMMWWGFGGYDAIAPSFLRPLFWQLFVYLCVELVVVHGLFFWSKLRTRKSALYGFLAPWFVVNLITLPQIGHDPKGALFMLFVPALCLAAYAAVEKARG